MKIKSPLIKMPKSISKLPKHVRIYKASSFKKTQENYKSALLFPVDTSKAACKNYGGGIKVGDVFEVLPGSHYDFDGKKLVAVGIGFVKRFQMFFYIEGDDGIKHFKEKSIKKVLKSMKKIGHINLP